MKRDSGSLFPKGTEWLLVEERGTWKEPWCVDGRLPDSPAGHGRGTWRSAQL